jgi:hypothetical protein
MQRTSVEGRKAFERLVKLGCPRWLLESACQELDAVGKALKEHTKERTPRKQRDAVKQKIRAVDAALSKVTSNILSLIKEPGTVSMLPELRTLLVAISAWKRGTEHMKGGHEPAFSHARAQLIDVVRTHTGNWRDEEVSVLVSHALGEVVDRLTQQRWRQRHGGLIRRTNLLRAMEIVASIDRVTQQ